MKKFRKSLPIIALATLSLGSFGMAAAPSIVAEEISETFECSVKVEEAAHGTISVDKTEGHVGDVVTITAKHDLFYMVDYVAVNGTNLIESEDISGVYTFALAEGENVISGKFIVDAELLGEMSVIYEQIQNKDWTNLFSVENVMRIISLIFSSGLLIAIVRYFIKDKRLEKKIENWINEKMEEILPATSKEMLLNSLKELIMPFFEKYLTEINVKIEDIENALTVFSRCMALAQENTPEAKMAITRELSSLKLSDQAAISAVEASIKAFIEEQNQNMANIIAKMNEMEAANKELIAQKEEKVEETVKEEEKVEEVEEVEEEKTYDGTQI